MGGPVAAEPAGSTAVGVIALVLTAIAIPVALASFGAAESSGDWESFAAWVIFGTLLSWLCTLVGGVTGLVCWLKARERRRRDWPALAATLLGVGTGVGWFSYLFLPAVDVIPFNSEASPTPAFAPERTLGKAARFRDPTGDAPATADIARVSVSSSKRGFIRFNVTYVSPVSEETATIVYLDTDKNAATGARPRFGADYAVAVWGVSATPDSMFTFSASYSINRWSGREFTSFEGEEWDVGLAGRVLTFTFDTSDLGKTSGGRFAVAAGAGEPWEIILGVSPDGVLDWAPNAGRAPWSFRLVKRGTAR